MQHIQLLVLLLLLLQYIGLLWLLQLHMWLHLQGFCLPGLTLIDMLLSNVHVQNLLIVNWELNRPSRICFLHESKWRCICVESCLLLNLLWLLCFVFLLILLMNLVCILLVHLGCL
uniref:Uncharacterized protein n=1 Tax=Ixodes ricinus TaxID=34613 RepID=A0A147BQ78_IXORI